jgi:hypothetical protein
MDFFVPELYKQYGCWFWFVMIALSCCSYLSLCHHNCGCNSSFRQLGFWML